MANVLETPSRRVRRNGTWGVYRGLMKKAMDARNRLPLFASKYYRARRKRALRHEFLIAWPVLGFFGLQGLQSIYFWARIGLGSYYMSYLGTLFHWSIVDLVNLQKAWLMNTISSWAWRRWIYIECALPGEPTNIDRIPKLPHNQSQKNSGFFCNPFGYYHEF